MDAFDEVVKLNLHGSIAPSLVFGEAMARAGRGSIVNISSMAATQAISGVLGYSVAKGAIDNFTRWLAVDLARRCGAGLRVNAIAPGFFIATQNRGVLVAEDGSYTPRAQAIVARTPMGRFGLAEELDGALRFLCSDAAAFVTGVVIPVDGGFSADTGI
jgi:NAD(P)-dependent dehydrogenase (short-subunit alcohol dehydrogenase family)